MGAFLVNSELYKLELHREKWDLLGALLTVDVISKIRRSLAIYVVFVPSANLVGLAKVIVSMFCSHQQRE